MQIFWHGLSCVRIEASNGDSEAVLVTDPYDSETGLRFPRTLAPDVVALSHQDRKRFPLDAFTSQPFIVSEPGEYESSGIFAYSVSIPNADKKYPGPLMYRFEAEGISIGFLGQLNRALTEEEMGKLENIDILLLPAGGGAFLTAKQAAEIVREIEPRIVVPLCVDVEGLKEKLGSANAFCKELGVKEHQEVNKLKIVRKDLPADDLVVTVIQRA